MKSQPFFREIYSLILSDTQKVVEFIQGARDKAESPLIRLSEEEGQLLQAMKLTDEQGMALRRAFYEAERSLVFGVLCITDGVAYTSEDISDLALVDRSTGESINQDFLHDEFYEALPPE